MVVRVRSSLTVVARTQRGRLMKFVRRNSLVIILLAGLLLCQRGSVGAQMQQTDDHSHMDMDESGGAAGEPAELQMARAIPAGPPPVTYSARIVGGDAQGKGMVRSEERRVGKECRSRWSPYH